MSTNTDSESSESSGSSDDSSDGNSSDSSDDDRSNEDSDGSNEDSDESNEDSDESKEDSEESKVDSDDDDSDESNDEKPALPNEEQNVTREKRKAENKDTIIAFKLVKLGSKGRGQRRERSWSSSPERGNGRAAVLSDFDSDEYEARDARPLGGSLAPYFALSRRTNTDARGASGDASRSSASARLHCA